MGKGKKGSQKRVNRGRRSLKGEGGGENRVVGGVVSIEVTKLTQLYLGQAKRGLGSVEDISSGEKGRGWGGDGQRSKIKLQKASLPEGESREGEQSL